jgi:hypothetical protein
MEKLHNTYFSRKVVGVIYIKNVKTDKAYSKNEGHKKKTQKYSIRNNTRGNKQKNVVKKVTESIRINNIM